MITIGGIVLSTSTAAALSDATPAALGVAAPGIALEASRADHVHAKPAAADISDASAAGRSLLTAANAAAQRSALAVPYTVGPFSVAALAAGSAAAPEDSTNQFLLYAGSLYTVLRAGSVTGLSVAMNPDPAAGSAVRVRVAVIDGGPPTFYDTMVATIADGSDHATATIAAGSIPVAAGALVGVVAQTGSAFTATAVPISAGVEITPS